MLHAMLYGLEVSSPSFVAPLKNSTFVTVPSVSEALAVNVTLAEGHKGLDNTMEPLRVVGNLPYNISTPILFHLLGAVDRVADQHFMLQKEVVERMAAVPAHPVCSQVWNEMPRIHRVRCRAWLPWDRRRQEPG